ncbi:TonB-dependent receptor [Algoriphagus boritolerans]|uniref:TonB-dependent Receptor Plug Domain n=3 Tax=Algoriphagus TaxID=246875 RepID=A0A1H6AKS1_9BACT|nr:TonB-dependent receptor [Algoriphagus boritolerans]SEG48830.1 TonB-dependent Receptor Plug Domain [Algoriphagus boritolerans DSM 17298 = JCM 18970]
MKRTILFLAVFILLTTGFAQAQNGIIRGTIFEEASGEPLYGVSVLVKELSTGAVTDFDGKFELQVAPGTYTIQVSYLSYTTINITSLAVAAGEVKVLDDLLMKEEASELETVTVQAAAIRTTESALMSVKRNAPNVMDGISASTFRQIGDGDAASAVKRVTGVSIEGGKYVYVRGLGDRYTKTVLNGVDVPGLDPDRNALQMDIFPTNVIDNILVSKSFTADLPADFTGGVVDIETKDFPEEKSAKLSISGGFNPSMHFNDQYLSYEGGKTDWLGFDDGTRAIPTGGRTDIPQFAQVVGNPNSPLGQEFQSTLRAFNKTLGGIRNSSLMDFGLGFSLGNQLARPKVTWGYNVAFTYRNETEYYKDAEFNLFAKPADVGVLDLEPLEEQKGDYGVNNVLLGGLAGIAMKTETSKYKLNFLHLQNGESKAGDFMFMNTNLGAVFEARQYNLEYSERALSSVLLSGTHFLNGRDWEINWKLAPTISKMDDPDIRFTRFRIPNNIIGTEVGLPTRIWRTLDEMNLVGKLDLNRQANILGRNGKIKFGGNYVYKERDFNIQSFQFTPGNITFTGDPNSVLNEENLFDEENRNGLRHNPDFIPNNPNAYQSNLTNIGAYSSAELNPSEKLKAVVGVRMEKYTQFYTGTNANASIVLDNEKVLDDLDFFPSLNLIYALKENQNLRLSATRTIARPSFKELSYAEILDPITGRSFIGGLFPESTDGGTTVLWDGNLIATRINNFDLRWELFQERGQMFSLSAFYKTFNSPIEMVQFLSDPGSFQPRNVGNGTVLGVEVELRKSLGIVSPKLENFSWTFNATLTESQIKMSATELRSRQLTAREGQTIEDTREMAGQAPYIINTGISYNNFTTGWEAGLFYNVQGPTLNLVGFGNRTDTFTVPFNSLNFNLNKSFGADERIQANFGVENILNDKRQIVYRSFEAQDQFFTNLSPGTEIKFGFTYAF